LKQGQGDSETKKEEKNSWFGHEEKEFVCKIFNLRRKGRNL
jgi:hypothetical protein